MTTSSSSKNMEAYVDRIKSNAEHLAKEIFPKKALELDEIINVNFCLEKLLKENLDLFKS